MKLSAFTPLGLLKLSAKPSPAKSFYNQMIAAVGGQFDTSEGTHVEASIYARAMGLGRSQAILERAGNQAWPRTILECLAEREREYGITPGPNDSIADRRRALGAAVLLPRGATLLRLQELFSELLGDAFLWVRAVPWAEAVNYPASLGDQPMNLQLPEIERKFIRTIDSTAGVYPASVTIRYEALDPNEPTEDYVVGPETKQLSTTRLLVGDTIVLDAENATRTERIAITAVGIDPGGFGEPAYRTFTGVFNGPHDAGVSGTTAPFPLWASSKRHYTIVLTVAGASDAETRRKADETAAKVFAGVATWSIAGGTLAGAGPFKVGIGLIGVTPIGTLIP